MAVVATDNRRIMKSMLIRAMLSTDFFDQLDRVSLTGKVVSPRASKRSRPGTSCRSMNELAAYSDDRRQVLNNCSQFGHVDGFVTNKAN